MSTSRFADAEAALKAGDTDKAVALTVAQLEADPAAPASIYKNFGSLLIRQKRYADAAVWMKTASSHYPRDYDLHNMSGVALRRLARFDEALAAFAICQKLDPKNVTALVNKGNVFNDQRMGKPAVDVFTILTRKAPQNAEYQRELGRALWHAGDLVKAEMRLNLATKLKPTYVDAWLDLGSVLNEGGNAKQALDLYDRAISFNPDAARLYEAKAASLRRANQMSEAQDFLGQMLSKFGETAWVHHQLGATVTDLDRTKANHHLQRAAELEPDNGTYAMAFAESLARSRVGDESEHIEHAYQVMLKALPLVTLDASTIKVGMEIYVRVADYPGADALGDFAEVGNLWASKGRHTALLAHLSRVKTPQDRHELIKMHRTWGEMVERAVPRWPIARPGPRLPNGKMRLGIMSSDLRGHPVAYFALPLFQHVDRSKFEIYCYSFATNPKDRLQAKIAEMVDVFRLEPELSDQQAAQMIANDQLDMLIELGGSTHMNKLNVMAWKPAPLQASWLGYPHSAGLKAIDHFILDPCVVPEDRSLVLEEPLLMPKSWIAMGELAFPERPMAAIIPERETGYLTFGTANNPYKYSAEMVRTWARITASVPGARFMFIRPEGGAPSFRKNILALFAEEGVGEDRVRFEDIRAAHMPFYNEVDISLDTFPQTGGTTTCEALFMGVPVVTLIGPAVFERLSYSILTNAGLGDLCARNVEDYVAIAQRLAADPDRRQHLRTHLRAMLKESPLGQTKQFALDFYNMIEGAITRDRQKRGV